MKRFLAILISATLILTFTLTFFAQAETVKFTDVDETTTRGAAIYKLVKSGVLVGYPDGTFRPDAEITRAELCKVVNLIFGYTEIDEGDLGFSDVKADDWFYQYVLAAKKAGYVKGYEDGTFRPENKITREETATILTRVANVYDLGITIKITDPVSDWAMPYVQMVLSNFLMPIEEGDTFRATENATRAEFCEAFSTFAKEVEQKPDEQKPDDNKDEEQKPPVIDDEKENGGFTGNTGEIVGGGDGNDDTNTGEDNNTDIEEQPPEEPDYATVNAEIISKLEIAKIDLENAIFDTNMQDYIQQVALDCVTDVLNNYVYTEIVDESFIRSTYSSQISEVRGIVNEMSEQDRKDFEDIAVVQLSGPTILWLREIGFSI
ncbi:MAG: S-layer homology domain-containing protein [Clostridia bacterium]|nr:S-layer homology domain-containing protein [Clostridia bacterium]